MSTSPEIVDATASHTEPMTGLPILDSLLKDTTEVTLEDLGALQPVNPALSTGFGEFAKPPRPEDTVITKSVAPPTRESQTAEVRTDPEATDTFMPLEEAPVVERLAEGIGGAALFATPETQLAPVWPEEHPTEPAAQ